MTRGEYTIETAESPFPTDPMERVGTILSGAINSGPKSILTLLLPHGGYISTQDLANLFRKAVAGSDTTFDTIDDISIARYCEHSLESVGLVARIFKANPGADEPPLGFALTDVGEKYGKRAAAIALQFEKNHPIEIDAKNRPIEKNQLGISIYSIFGQTATNTKEVQKNDKRAPTLRAKLLFYLYEHTEDPISMPMLRNAFPDYDQVSIYNALRGMGKYGIVEGNSLEGKHNVPYTQTGKSLETGFKSEQKKLSVLVIKAIDSISKADDLITVEGIAKLLYPTQQKGRDKNDFNDDIAKIIKELYEFGYIKTDTAPYINYSLSERGKIVITELIQPLLLLMQDNADFINDFDQTTLRKVDDDFKSYARVGVRNYYPYSQGYKRKFMLEYVDGRILAGLSTAKGLGLNRNEICQTTGTSIASLPRRLNRLMQQGLIMRKPGGGQRKFIYFITETGAVESQKKQKDTHELP